MKFQRDKKGLEELVKDLFMATVGALMLVMTIVFFLGLVGIIK